MFSKNSYHNLNENEQLHTLNSIFIEDRTFTIKDDCVIHHTSINLPFSSTIKIYIHPNKINDILQISNLLSYDQDKQTLSANSSSIANNIALLYLAAKVTVKELSLQKIIERDMVNKYLHGQGKPATHIKNSLIRILYKNIGKNPRK